MSTIRRIVGRLIITICGYKNTTLFVAFISHKWINTFLFEKKKYRYTKWTDGCGVRVRNVSMNDEGRWRLTANGSNKLTGWTELFVEGTN